MRMRLPMPRAVPPALLLGLLLSVLFAPHARADVLELKDGRLVEGVVVQDGESYVVRSRFGVTEIPVAEVKARHEAKSFDEQVRAHLAKLDPDDMQNRALLARWMKDVGREEEGRAMAELVLESDPQNAVAHEVLGHIRHQGVWRTPDEAKRAEGLEKHGDQWYTPQEWANVKGAARKEALERERQSKLRAMGEEVNRAVRLMLSPDKELRAKGRARLEALAKEYENPKLTELARHVDAYVKKADEIAAAAAAVDAGNLAASGSGYVLGEIRATLSKLKRPIETFETSLASNIGGAPVKIQLPELEVIRVRTTVGIPAVVR